jgi:type II secretory pathway predicted ATPase ExeA
VETVSERTGEGSSFVVNSVVNNLRTLARKAFEKRRIVAYSGRAGLGKSTAVDSLPGFLSFPHRIIRCKQTTSLRALVRALALGEEARKVNPRNSAPTYFFYDQAVQTAKKEPFLLVIDEADRLHTNCFECVRDLWDDARLPVLLVGNEDLEGIISSRHERLARRIGIRFVQKPLRDDQLRAIIEHLKFEVSDEEFAKLCDVCGGSPGWAEAVLNTRDDVAASYKERPNMDHLKGALEYFPSLGGRQ